MSDVSLVKKEKPNEKNKRKKGHKLKFLSAHAWQKQSGMLVAQW